MRREQLQPHDVAVGLVLGEGQVEEVVGLLARVAADEVGCHVVRRAERRLECVRPGRGQRGDLVEGHVGVPQHGGVAEVVDPPPPGPASTLNVVNPDGEQTGPPGVGLDVSGAGYLGCDRVYFFFDGVRIGSATSGAPWPGGATTRVVSSAAPRRRPARYGEHLDAVVRWPAGGNEAKTEAIA